MAGAGPSDIEKGQATESTALLPRRRGSYRTTTGSMGDSPSHAKARKESSYRRRIMKVLDPVQQTHFMGDLDPKFVVDFSLTLRASIGCLLIGLVYIVPELQYLRNMNIQWGYLVVFYIFLLRHTMGGTIRALYAGFVGSAIAVINIYILFGIFPQGGSTTAGWYVGIIDVCAMLFIMNWLNWDDMDTRMFGSSLTCEFVMNFLNPQNTETYSVGFAITADGYATKVITATLLACVLSLAVCSIPTPHWALDDATCRTVKLMDKVTALWDDITDYYMADRPSVVAMERVKQDARFIQEDIDALQDAVDDAYFESFNFGQPGRIRQQIIELHSLLTDAHACMQTAILAIEREDFFDDHHVMLEYIDEALLGYVRTVNEVSERCMTAMLDGELDHDEARELHALEAALKASADTFVDAVRTGRQQTAQKLGITPADIDMVDESFFLFAVSEYARLVHMHALSILDTKCMKLNAKRFQSPIRDVRDYDTLMDPIYLNWVARNVISLLLAFLIGYFPFSHSGSGVFTMYDGDIPSICAFLILRQHGSTIVMLMHRLLAVLLGTILAQMTMVLLVSETRLGQLTHGVGYFLLVFVAIYLNRSSKEYAYMGGVTAVFISKSMFHTAQETPELTKDIAYNTWSNLIRNMVCILCLLVVDNFIRIERTSITAIRYLKMATAEIMIALKCLFDGKLETQPVLLGTVRQNLRAAAIYGDDAKKEILYWHKPWNSALWEATLLCEHRVRSTLVTLARCIVQGKRFGGKKTEILTIMRANSKEMDKVGWRVRKRFDTLYTIAISKMEHSLNVKKLVMLTIDEQQAPPEKSEAFYERLLKELYDALQKEKPEHFEEEQTKGLTQLADDPLVVMAVLVSSLAIIEECLDDFERAALQHA